MDYQKYFKLNENPFKSAADSRFYFKRRADAHIFNSILSDECGTLIHLKGPDGAGKSALLARLPQALRKKYKTALVLNPQLKFSEILRQALSDFGHGHKFDLHTPEEALLGFFQNAVTDYIDDGFHILLAVDDAHDLAPETLGEFHTLSSLEPHWAGRVHLLLSGSADKPWPLSLDLATLAEELELPPLEADETREYLAHRLKTAGGELCFNRQGLGLLTEYSRGLPQRINLLAERAMIAAWSAGRPLVGAEHLKAAKTSLENPLTYTPESSGGGVIPGPERKLAARLRRKPLLVCLGLALLAALGFWKMAADPAVPQPPEPPPPLEGPPPETATPAADNQAAEESGVLAPALPATPPQLLRLPQGAPVMVIDLDKKEGRLWQGGPRGAGLKAEVASPEFKERGLYLFGRPRGQNALVFQYPPARDIPTREAARLWPRIATLLPQNMLPVIIGRGRDLARDPSREKNDDLAGVIDNRVKAWVESQQYKFADATAELYAASFQFFELGQEPRTVKRDDFRAALHSEAATAGEVSLTVSLPLIMRDPANQNIVWAVFQLRYESRLRHDMGTRTLVFEKGIFEDWQIVAELWLPEKSLRGD